MLPQRRCVSIGQGFAKESGQATDKEEVAADSPNIPRYTTKDICLPPNPPPLQFRRYFAKDNWNILDTLSILCVLVAFFFRLLAFLKDTYTDATLLSGIIQQARDQYDLDPSAP